MFNIRRFFCSSARGMEVAPAFSSRKSRASEKSARISRAMQAYLRHKAAHEGFMQKQRDDFELGKRYLASIIGAPDADHFTQEQIDRAIQYLLPSGLMDKAARPILKPPDEIFPRTTEAQFGEDGRPFSCFFYTRRPQYYSLMHEAAWQLERLKQAEDALYAQKVTSSQKEVPDVDAELFKPPKLDIEVDKDMRWLSHEELATNLNEPITNDQYARFLTLGSRIISHPMAYAAENYLRSVRVAVGRGTSSEFQLLPISQDAAGNHYVDSRSRRKHAFSAVRVWAQGNGDFAINDQPLVEYFDRIFDREQLLFPLLLSGKLGQVDVDAKVWGGGPTGQAGAIRHALSLALCSLVSDNQIVEKMRISGLLTLDIRHRERKKPGQEGARRKFTWKKR